MLQRIICIAILCYWFLPFSAFAVPDRMLGVTTGSGIPTEMSPSDVSTFLGGSASGTLDAAFDAGPTINGATSANPLRVGDGALDTTDVCINTDSTIGGAVRPCSPANTKTPIWTDKTHCLYDIEGASCMETFDPDASLPSMYTYQSGYRPWAGVWIGAGALSVDGTNCANPAEVTLNSGPKLFTIICADNSSSTIYGSFLSPQNWDASSLLFAQVIVQTAADTNAINGDISAQCRGAGETVSNTWGTSDAMDTSVTGSNKNDKVFSGGVVPAGTCAAGDMVYFKYVLDATGTTTAMGTLHVLGFNVFYKVASRSQ